MIFSSLVMPTEVMDRVEPPTSVNTRVRLGGRF